MYCPNSECSYLKRFGVVADFQDHITVCVECGTALKQGVAQVVEQSDELVGVYSSPFEFKVASAKALLETEGIESVESGLYAHDVFGGAFDTTHQPTLQVAVAKAERARELLAELDSKPTEAADWACPECGTRIPGELDACWNCAGELPPDADPDVNDDEDLDEEPEAAPNAG